MFATWLSSYRLQCFELLLFFSPFLDAGKREALADYALVVAVLVMSFVASYFMRDIQSKYIIDLDKTASMKLNTTSENSPKKHSPVGLCSHSSSCPSKLPGVLL